jgi:hypothetical protein
VQEPGGDQEAREPIKLACQTLESNETEAICTRSSYAYQPSQRSAGHQTKLTLGVGPPGFRTPGTEGGKVDVSGGNLMTRQRQQSSFALDMTDMKKSDTEAWTQLS